MPNDEVQKARPQIQKGPSLSDARSETRLPLADSNPFRRPDQVGNELAALAALCLGIVSLILSVWWVLTVSSNVGEIKWQWRLGLGLVLILSTLIFGIFGLKCRSRCGFGLSIVGILMGILTIFGLFLWYILLVLSAVHDHIGH
jgi:hypothetical protein